MATRDYTCGICGEVLIGRAALHVHRANVHRLQFGGGELQDSPFGENERPFEGFPDEMAMNTLYRDNEVYILRPHMLNNDNVLVFNYPIKGHVSEAEIERQMRDIYENDATANAFKLELTAGVILRGTDDGQLRYYKPETNAYLLDLPLVIDGPVALEQNIQYLQSLDVDSLVRNFRPNTKYVVQFVTQLEWHVWPMDYPLGGKTNTKVPTYIRDNKSIITEFDYSGYENCCLFIALSQHRYPKSRYCDHKRQVNALLLQWFRYCHDSKDIAPLTFCAPHKFKGVEWRDLHHFETCFQINLCILQFQPGKTALTTYSKRKRFPDTLYLNEFEGHLSYIVRIESYCQRFQCDHCLRLFKKHYLMARHRLNCGKKSKYRFPSAAFKYHKTVFEELAEVGIVVGKEHQYYSHVICFDLEAALLQMPGPLLNRQGQPPRTTYVKVHQAISCSIASNIPGHTEPVFIVDKDPDSLVLKMFLTFDTIRVSAAKLAREKWGPYLMQLEQKLEGRRVELNRQFIVQFRQQQQSHTATADMCDEQSTDYDKALKKYLLADPVFTLLQRLYRDFYLYIHRCVILTFNGAKYDVPLLKGPLIKFLLSLEGQEVAPVIDQAELFDEEREFELMYGSGNETYDIDVENDVMTVDAVIAEMKLNTPGKLRVIKRANAYVSLSNNLYTFLDVINYLAPGCNYKKFLKAYNAEGDKGYWCYEYIDSFEKLSMPLPPYPSAAWTSRLKGDIDILNEDYAEWEAGGKDGPMPLNGPQVYAEIQKEWEREGYTCLLDMLRSYNNNDARPFISAANNMMKEYFAMDLDIFKVSVSPPGLSRILMMRCPQRENVLFLLFNKEDRDAYFWLKKSVCAGASLTFDRYCHTGETHLHPDKKYKCLSVYGFDFNSLYLGLFKNPMPTSMYVRRFEEESYTPKYRPQIYAQYIWLNHISKVHNMFIKSRQNQGMDIKVGSYFVDGMHIGQSGQITILEYLGCFWHQCRKHTCTVTKGGRVGVEGAYEKWLEKKKYLESRNYKLIYIWECEMGELLKQEAHLKAEMEALKPAFLKRYPHAVTMSDIIEGVRSGLFYGFLECDLHVPEALYGKFEGFPPLFSNHDVTPADVGPVMGQYIKDKSIKIVSRRLLISGMAAKGLLLNSRLLAYYLSLGLVITRISQTIEFVAKACFKEFVSEVTSRRQEAALNPDRKVIGELYKLLGNAAFGSQVSILHGFIFVTTHSIHFFYFEGSVMAFV